MAIDWKHILGLSVLCGGLLTACVTEPPAQQEGPDKPELDKNPALIAACNDWKQGGGSETTGGEGAATVYRITNLDDIDAYKPVVGTLRYAVEQPGPRIIVFDVAGTIHLSAPLTITNGNLSILGQSAPGQGICIADYPVILKNTYNIVLRFLRVRLGNHSLEKDSEADYDALSVNDCHDILIDHCSFSWSVDECVSCYGNENFTLQYCFITESLRNAGHVKGAHGYGGIWGGKNATFHHNLLAHHDSRNPRFDHDYVFRKSAGPIDFVNNVVYDWGSNSAYGGEGSDVGAGGRQINFVNNYYKPGPATKSGVKTRLLNPKTKCDNCTDACGGTVVPGKFYLVGNVMDGSDAVTNDNWQGVFPDESSKLDLCKAATRWTTGLTKLDAEQTAWEAYETVLGKAGCSLSRDAVDMRIVQEVRNASGKLIDSQDEAGGWPELEVSSLKVDTDNDGIPDEWELKYGLDPNSAADARQVSLVTGYTNLEVYLNDIVKELY